MDALNLTAVLQTLIWASLVFAIILFLKKPIYDLINRIKSAKWGGRELLLDTLRIEEEEETDTLSKEEIIFRLGRSLTGLADYILMGHYIKETDNSIVPTFDYCIRYAKDAGFAQYAEIFDQIRKNYLSQTKALEWQDRLTMFDKIEEITREITKELSVTRLNRQK
jgi:hypothetical protein